MLLKGFVTLYLKWDQKRVVSCSKNAILGSSVDLVHGSR